MQGSNKSLEGTAAGAAAMAIGCMAVWAWHHHAQSKTLGSLGSLGASFFAMPETDDSQGQTETFETGALGTGDPYHRAVPLGDPRGGGSNSLLGTGDDVMGAPPSLLWWTAVLGATFGAAILEAVTDQLDNLVVPVYYTAHLILAARLVGNK